MSKIGVIPVEYKVLIKKDNIEERTRGGIILPPAARESQKFAQEKATFISKGSLAFTDWGITEQDMMVEGVRVLINKYAGIEVKDSDGESYHIMSDKDVTAILTEE